MVEYYVDVWRKQVPRHGRLGQILAHRVDDEVKTMLYTLAADRVHILDAAGPF